MYNDYTTFRAQQKSFSSSDGEIKYTDKGNGNPILLLHGIPCSSWLYRKMIKDLSSKGFRVIAPDMLGFGNSDNPKGYEVYSQEQHGKRILELMDALEIKSWTHVMHDASGLWSWELLKKSPKRVDNLVILNTLIYEEGFNPPIKMKRGNIAKISMWEYRNGITTNLLLNNLFKMGLNENNLTKSEIEGYKKPLKEGRTKAMYYFFTQTCNTFPDYQSVYSTLRMPKLVIWGKNDEMLQIELQRDKIISGLNILPENIHILDATHLIQEEKHLEIDGIIMDFLKQ